MVYESDFYTSRRPYSSSRPTISSYSVTRLGDSGEWDSPYSWPVRREFSRILHRPRPHIGIVYTERFLNSRPLTYFDDETKIIRAKAGALLRQVHNPLPKPSKVLRPYESLDAYTAHHSLPYGVPQHVYHQSYFSEPAHLTIGRGHLACIQFAGGKGYPRRKHLYSDENRNIRDEIKFRSYYNRPRNEDPSSLPTGFASRLLHLPPKDNKPFKMYKHSRTLPLLDSSKFEKKKPDSKEEEKERPSYRRYQKTLTEPIDDTLKTETNMKVQITKEEIIKKPKEDDIVITPRNDTNKEELRSCDLNDIKVNKKPKEESSTVILEERDVIDDKKSKKMLKTSSNRPLNKSKSLVSEDKEVEVEKPVSVKEEEKKNDAPASVAQIPVIEDKPTDKPTDKPEQKNEPLQDAPSSTVDKVTTENLVVKDNHEETLKSLEQPCTDEVKMEENLNKVQEVPVQDVQAQEAQAQKECNIADATETKPTEEVLQEIAPITSVEKPAQQEPSGALPEIEEKVTLEKIDNPPEPTDKPTDKPEPTDTVKETAPKEELIETNIKTDIIEEKMVKSPEDLSPTENPKTEDSIQDHQTPSVEETSQEIISNEPSVKMETVAQVEDSNIILEDNEPPNRLDDTGVTITQIHEESNVTITHIPDEVSEITYTERSETSETVYSKENTVIQEVSSTEIQISEALAESEKQEVHNDTVNN